MAVFQYDSETTIHYKIHGNRGRAVLCVHGFGDTGETWDRILPFLSGDNILIIPDLRGCGSSSKPKDNHYDLEDHVLILAALLEHLRLKRVTLVGHSFGGAIALRLALEIAARNPEHLEGLVLIDAAGFPQRIPVFVQIPALPVIGPIILYMVPARVQCFFSIRPLYRTPHTYTTARATRYANTLRSRGGVRALIETARRIIADRNPAWLPGICSLQCETLILWGMEDPAVPLSNAYLMEKAIAKSKLVVFPSCGHVTQEEVPEIAGPLLYQFLSQ